MFYSKVLYHPTRGMVTCNHPAVENMLRQKGYCDSPQGKAFDDAEIAKREELARAEELARKLKTDIPQPVYNLPPPATVAIEALTPEPEKETVAPIEYNVKLKKPRRSPFSGTKPAFG